MNSKNSGIQVVDRLARLLEAIANAREPVSAVRYLSDTGLHPSTAFRILAALQQHDLVEKNPNGSYELGRRLLRLAQQVPVRSDLREVAKPILNWLRDQTGEPVNLPVREGDEVLYVERAVPTRMMRVEQIIGIGAPVRNADGEAVAGLSISAPRERRRDEWIPLLQEAGARLSRQLGHAQ